MKILLSWLREYLDLPETPEVLAQVLTRAGIEVDRIEKAAPNCVGVITARITDVEPHPHAQKLHLAKIYDGIKEHRIVCGAANCRKGIVTAFAPVGASICKEGALYQIEKADIKGIESPGCLCSEQEIGLTDINNGIIELPEETKEGLMIDELFSDTVFELSLTPNLGHCLSVMGVARELSAFLNRPLKKAPWKEAEQLTTLLPATSPKLTVTVVDPKLCARYSGVLVENVSACSSPLWIRLRLERSGYRSINTIVDATNYVMHDIGQPLHAFDADKVANGHLIVRSPNQGETLLFLDEQTRGIQQSGCVIADSEKALALGGVMGGLQSAVSEATTRIIFEAAFFPPSIIRKGRGALSLHTDASRRFERGTDPNITLNAIQEALSLLQHAKPEALCDIYNALPTKKITCRITRSSAVLGYEVSTNEIESSFNSLGLASSWDGQNSFTVTVPSYRHDLNEEIDLIEEIGRLVGLQQEVLSVPKYATSKLAHSAIYSFEKEVRRGLLAEGLQEVITCDLISPTMSNIVMDHPIAGDSLVKVLNPLSTEQSILRPSLLPGMLEVLKRNIRQRTLNLKAFEVGHAHLQKEQKYQEPLVFGILLSGKSQLPHFSTATNDVDFFDLKGILESLFASLGLNNFALKQSDLSILHPSRQAKIYLSNVHVGMIGEIHPAVLRSLGIEQRVYFAECDVQELWKLPQNARQMQQLAQYPSSERDWTVTASKRCKFEELSTVILAEENPLLENLSLVSIYQNENLGVDKQNLTMRFTYRDRQKTVSQEEVDLAHAQLVTKASDYLTKKYSYA